MSDLREVGLRLLDPRLPGWGFPRWGSSAAAGLDLHACLDAPLVLPPQAKPVLIPAGFSVLIRDPGLVRADLSRVRAAGTATGLVLGNGTGVIDADYEGPLMVSAWNRDAAGRRSGSSRASGSRNSSSPGSPGRC